MLQDKIKDFYIEHEVGITITYVIVGFALAFYLLISTINNIGNNRSYCDDYGELHNYNTSYLRGYNMCIRKDKNILPVVIPEKIWRR